MLGLVLLPERTRACLLLYHEPDLIPVIPPSIGCRGPCARLAPAEVLKNADRLRSAGVGGACLQRHLPRTIPTTAHAYAVHPSSRTTAPVFDSQWRLALSQLMMMCE